MKNLTICSWALGMLMLAYPASAQQPYTFVSIDVQCGAAVPAAACPTGLSPGQTAAQTGLRGINARGDVVGFYAAGGRQHGFVLRDGQYTTLDFPISGVRATIANGINAQGEIVGQYTLPVHDLANPPAEDSPLYCPSATDPACIKAFYYSRGNFWTFTFPTTTDENGQAHVHPGAIAQRITDDGNIYGCLHDHDLGMSMIGAAWTRFGAFSLLANGGEVSDPMPVTMSMNNGATNGGTVIAGLFTDMSNQTHGYLVRSGVLEPYDATPAANFTAIWDMNTHQQFVGVYRLPAEPAPKRHGFVQPPDQSAAITLDFTCEDSAGCAGAPLGTVAFSTNPFGINPAAVIVGQYQLVTGGAPHGFVAVPADQD